MIRYALICHDCEAEFEAWFSSSDAYDTQASKNQLECVSCSGHDIRKQIMAPSVRSSRKGANAPSSKASELMAAAREHIAATHDYTGTGFPDEARAMHYGEIEQRPIWGEASPEEAKTLLEEGVNAVPLPASLAPKPPKDTSDLN